MKNSGNTRALVAAIALAAIPALLSSPAGATGTARIQQSDGTVKTYSNVRITVGDEGMSLTSSDGVGTIDIGKAACTKIGELVHCLPYEATLHQHGKSGTIVLKSGSVWVNPTQTAQTLSHSSTSVPPHGVVLAIETKKGTYLTLTGTVDKVTK